LHSKVALSGVLAVQVEQVMLTGGKLDWRVWVITLRVLRWPEKRRERRGRRETWGVCCRLEALLVSLSFPWLVAALEDCGSVSCEI
jgi:hypothetical protein